MKMPGAQIRVFSPVLQHIRGCLEQMLSMCWLLSPLSLGKVSSGKAKH